MAEEVNASQVTMGSPQGANRTKVIREASGIKMSSFQAKEITQAESREFGASRNPGKIHILGEQKVGVIEVNSARAVQLISPPEIGKGSITDILV